MLEENIKVSWIEKRNVSYPLDYNSTPTKEDWEAYDEAVRKATIKKQGTIIAFQKGFFGDTYAIINSGDNKIVRININKLTVIHQKKEKHGKK